MAPNPRYRSDARAIHLPKTVSGGVYWRPFRGYPGNVRWEKVWESGGMVFKERRKKPRRDADVKDKGHETDLVREGEREFIVTARRNKLLGLWAAERMGITGDAAQAYSKEVVVSDLEEPGDDDVVRKVMKDLAEKGADITEDRLRREMDALLEVARRQTESDRA